MRFHLDFKAGKPVYLQLVDQVKTSAASGGLRPEDALPSIRDLATELRVNRNTVAKAYAELEAQGVIESLPGKGSFVRGGQSLFKKDVRLRLLRDAIDAAVVQGHHLQVGRQEFLRLAEARFDEFERTRSRAASE